MRTVHQHVDASEPGYHGVRGRVWVSNVPGEHATRRLGLFECGRNPPVRGDVLIQLMARALNLDEGDKGHYRSLVLER